MNKPRTNADNQKPISVKTTSEKPVSLPSDFEKTLKALLETKPEPKDKKNGNKKPNSR